MYLAGYDFPGNVRELRNLLARGCLLAGADMVAKDHFPASHNRDEREPALAKASFVTLADTQRAFLASALAIWQRDHYGLA